MIKKFNNYKIENSNKINEDRNLGIINVHVDGNGKQLVSVLMKIQETLSTFQGEIHLFLNNKEITDN